MTRAITQICAVASDDAGVRAPDQAYVTIPVDLNKGSGGKYIYLCYLRGDGPPITSLRVVKGKNRQPDPGYELVRNPETGSPQDLNQGAGGEYLYMEYSTETRPDPVIDLVVRAHKFGDDPRTPKDEFGNAYTRVEGELNEGAHGWYVFAFTRSRQPDPDPLDYANVPLNDVVKSYLKKDVVEISRAQISLGRVLVTKRQLQGDTDIAAPQAEVKRVYTKTVGMSDTEATTLASEASFKTSVSTAIKWGQLSTEISAKAGYSHTQTFSTVQSTTVEQTIWIPADPQRTTARVVYSLQVVDLVEIHALSGGPALVSAVNFMPTFLAAYQDAGAPSPAITAHRLDFKVRQVTPESARAAVPAGTYMLTAVHSGKALDVGGASTANGAAVIQWDAHGGTNQQWRLEPVAGTPTYRLIAAHSGKALDVSGASTANGAAVIQWDAHGGTNQQWNLRRI